MRSIAAISFRQLRAVAALEEAGSISGAAHLLGLTPPAVHSQLRALEDLLSCSLTERDARGRMRLTEEGRLVLEAQRRIDTTLRGCANRIEALSKGLSGRVVLGAVSTGKYYAPALVRDMKKQMQGIDLQLVIGNRNEILTALSEQSVDLAIMGRPPRDPPVRAVGIGPHPMIVIAAPDNPLAGRGKVSPEELLSQTFIAREEGSGTRILMIRYLDRIGEGMPYEAVTMGSNETIKQAVMAGLGVAMISQHTVTEELKAGRLVALNAPELPIVRRWFALHLAEQELRPATRRVWDFITAHAESYLPRLEAPRDPAGAGAGPA